MGALAGAFLGAAACASRTAAPAKPVPVSDSPAQAAIRNATAAFGEGRELALNGDFDCAREAFAKALAAVGPGSGAPAGDRELAAFSSDLWDSILRYEALATPAEEAAAPEAPAAPALAALEEAKASEEEMNAARSAVISDASGAPYDIPMVINEPVLKVLAVFQNDLHPIIARGLARSGRYLPMIHRVFAEEGIPRDLAQMAMVESAFVPRAVSSARAHGLWQFMARTGRQYGLASNSLVDERSDPEKATRAAARYLTFLYELFHDWYLAMAAYNAGEGKILKAMAKTGATDFWQLAQTRAIKPQTQSYVPAVLAATLINRNPAHYGFEVEHEPALLYDTVVLDRSVSLAALSRASQVPLEDLQALNPELKRSITPKQPDGYGLKVPPGQRETVAASLASVPTAKMPNGKRYVVRKGDTLAKIARKSGVSEDELAAFNGLAPGASVGRGRALEIPERPAAAEAARAKKPAASPRESKVSAEPPSPTSYKVRNGDTLYAIARKHGTTVEELTAANSLSPETRIRPGDTLTIPPRSR
jgi:membrane-bound lytic murein transglycosylase D